jgi:hypothetical protein
MCAGRFAFRLVSRTDFEKEKNRMKSSKWILGLMVAVLVVALAPSSFAQVNIQIFNTPSPQEIATARNAQTADPSSTGNGILVSGALIANSPLTATALTFTFPATITSSTSAITCTNPDGSSISGCNAGNSPNVPTNDPIAISGATGLFAGVAIASINYNNGTIQLNLPGTLNNTGSGTFRLVGVRLDVNGKTAPLNASAALGSSSNNYILQTTTVPVISALGPGIGSVTVGANGTNANGGTALLFTNQTTNTPADATASVVIAEGFASAWRTTTQVGTQGIPVALMNGTLVQLTVNGLPAGVSANLTLAGKGGSSSNGIGGATSLGGNGVAFATTGSTSATVQAPSGSSPNRNIAYVQFNSDSLSTVESFQVDITLSGTPSSTLVPGTITLDVTMGPVGPALTPSTATFANQPSQSVTEITPPSGTATGLSTGYVRFAASATTITIGSIVSANTTLLIPYAVRVGTYDTGIAIANTTLDPFGASGGATPSAGTMTFTMFPRNATGADPSFALTTSSTVRPGVGLSTSGTLVAGGTWTGLMSDIMTAAGKTGDYFGYIFIQTNFLNAHGAAYIFNGAGFTSSTPVLVLVPPASQSRNGPFPTGVESLSF